MTPVPNEQSPTPQTIEQPCVLIVDDAAGMRAYIRECLAVLPVRVEEAGDGLGALQ